MSDDNTIQRGDIIIRRRSDGPGYKCFIAGEGFLGSGLVGYGDHYGAALQSFNYKSWEKSNDLKDAKLKAEKEQKRKLKQLKKVFFR